MPMRVLHVCAEVYPLLKTGGLADVTAGLPPAQLELGCDARILVPGFPDIRDGIADLKLVAQLPPRFGADVIRLYHGVLPERGIPAYVVDAPALYDRPGNPYADANRHPYPDNHRRFALLSWVALRLAQGLDSFWCPQIVHGHDWHAGLMPAYLSAARQATGQKLAASVFTVHNLAYQGVFSHQAFGELDLPGWYFDIDGVEFHGQLSFLKAGLHFADKITTVSPTYAREIHGHEQGYGLHGLLQRRSQDLHGILNGVDDTVWHPSADALIAARYDSRSIAGKSKCKAALQQQTGLAVRSNAPLFCVVSRLTEQKGLNLILAVLPEIVRRGGQFVLLGSGDADLEGAFRACAGAHPESVAVTIGYDEALSHRIIAGSDVILVPSRFEPCGLTQLYGLKYGTLPLVRSVGGLADTVVDCALENLADDSATGFVFERFDDRALDIAVRRAFALYDRKADWNQVRKRGMQQCFGWDTAAKHYLSLYHQIAA
ncbi:glycogen synthase GlgA [Paraburkholderia bryophila]|uniref:glycogen synthase GlgA n=1 Tax=Paraburkholderia bryophila TaxID=420952 RepID=UPI00234A548F|nr:glycogen synthase GlgA [Paraburkholderia bryophila]WCM24852.1 glycogen synthase GlgA [Paraburkholderia bryophila]